MPRVLAGPLSLTLLLTLAPVGSPAAQPARAEVQVKVCTPPPQAIAALKLKPAKRPSTRMWLYDTPTFGLQQKGVLVRVRDDGRHVQLTTKARVPACSQVDPRTLGSDGKCETDLHGEHVQDAVSISSRLRSHQATALLAADAAYAAALLPSLMTPEQRALLLARAGGIPAGLRRLGPATVALYDWPATGAEVEVWALPGLEPLIEASEKTAAAEAPALQRRLEQQVTAVGLTLCADQGSRTPARLKALSG